MSLPSQTSSFVQDEPGIDHVDPFHFPLSIAAGYRAPSRSPSFVVALPVNHSQPFYTTTKSNYNMAGRRRANLPLAPASRHAPAAHYMRSLHPAPHHRTSIRTNARTNAQTGVPEAASAYQKKPRVGTVTRLQPTTPPPRASVHSSRGTFPFKACSRRLAMACAGRSAAVTGAAYSPSGQSGGRTLGAKRTANSLSPLSHHRPVPATATGPPMSSG
ncbi:hypothetical protein GRF29_19g2835753 [Pseudopithomyces chartarum]|uniref:Uncharacterized protein n=1 Tax=Pseudopithomyces chartarum TaxID=1892770 RepID=A0AAN6M6Q1_9PLEO|nr:hypothetical protein GRF29_19g2835753 [Pseudopithomyces chartarum]